MYPDVLTADVVLWGVSRFGKEGLLLATMRSLARGCPDFLLNITCSLVSSGLKMETFLVVVLLSFVAASAEVHCSLIA